MDDWGDFNNMDLGPSDTFDSADGNFNLDDAPTADEPSFDATGYSNGEELNIQGGNDGGINPKKVFIISLIASFILLMILLFIGARVLGGKQEDTDETVEVTQNVEEQSEGSNIAVENAETNTVKVVQPTVKSGADWVAFDVSTLGDQIQHQDGYFTVTKVETLAKLKGVENGNYLRCILYGNITGLSGEYELVIPVESAMRVASGDVININYSFVIINGEKIVVDIQ